MSPRGCVAAAPQRNYASQQVWTNLNASYMMILSDNLIIRCDVKLSVGRRNLRRGFVAQIHNKSINQWSVGLEAGVICLQQTEMLVIRASLAAAARPAVIDEALTECCSEWLDGRVLAEGNRPDGRTDGVQCRAHAWTTWRHVSWPPLDRKSVISAD